jgi:hypothetical protein
VEGATEATLRQATLPLEQARREGLPARLQAKVDLKGAGVGQRHIGIRRIVEEPQRDRVVVDTRRSRHPGDRAGRSREQQEDDGQ